MLPQRTRFTKRPQDWRRAKRANLSPSWRTGNEPDMFLPGVDLNPSRVRDMRGGQPLIESIAAWFSHVGRLPRKPLPKRKPAPKGSPFRGLQQSYQRYNMDRAPQPQPGPAPAPNSLLGQYRR